MLQRRLIKKVGSRWFVFSIKDRFDERNDSEMSKRTGRKISATTEAKHFSKWQRDTNGVKTLIKKDGPIHAVYISSKPFETKDDATKYLIRLG